MWVPLVENHEHLSPGADYFVRLYLDNLMRRDPLIDTLILGCTHYPKKQTKIEEYLNSTANNQQSTFNIISQGNIVANSLQDYLQRHPDIAQRALNHKINHIGAMNSKFLTTESAAKFSESASLFLSEQIAAQHIEL